VEESLLKKLKRFSREHTIVLSIIGLIIGIFLFAIGTVGIFFADMEISVISDIVDRIGYWYYWAFALALILTFASMYFMYMTVSDRNKFYDLIDTGSKATFVRNQDELEEIAFRLGSSYQEELFEKKRELKIK
jgi:hypothetical protein